MQRVTTDVIFCYLWHVLSETWQRNSSFKGLKSSRHRREDNINMDLQEVGWGLVDRIEMAQDRERLLAVVSVVMNFWVP
jgi:hypothetical protein